MASILENQSPHYVEIKATAAADLTNNPLVVVNDLNVFPLLSEVSNGDDYAAVKKSPKVRAMKTAALTINSGDVLYYNTTTNLITKTNTDTLVGFAIADAAAADTHVLMAWDGALAFAKA